MDVVSELKRRLDDNEAPLPKRLRLAENVVSTSYFPTQKKDEIVIEWLISKLDNLEPGDDFVSTVGSLTSCFKIAPTIGAFSTDLKSKIVKVLANHLKSNTNDSVVKCVITLLNNDSTYSYFCHELNNYLSLTKILLKQLLINSELTTTEDGNKNILLSEKDVEIGSQIFDNVESFFKTIGRKVQFIESIIDTKSLQVIFKYFNVLQLKEKALHLCQVILFPVARKTFYSSFLVALIKTDSVHELIESKGDNLKSVLKVMNTFFVFHAKEDFSYLDQFIESFVYSYKSDSSLIFVLYCIAYKCVNLYQTYLEPLSDLPTIKFPESNQEVYKKKFYLNSLQCLRDYEIDLNVRLIDSFGDNFSKVEINRYFTNYLQAVTLHLLKSDDNIDVTSLKIIMAALKLDPAIVDTKMDQFLPNIMTMKKKFIEKNADYIELYDNYTIMLTQLLETIFKLSKGIEFVPKILPLLILNLETINEEQFALTQKELNLKEKNKDTTKVVNKIITGDDIFPRECCIKFGKLSSELMLRQNLELFEVLKKQLEEHCLNMLAEGFVSPSVVVTTEILCQLLGHMLEHCRMADHSAILQIADKFWVIFQTFEDESLKQFGETLLKLSPNERLTNAFLNLSLCFGNLKLLNIKYGNTKLICQTPEKVNTTFECTLDLSLLLPFLTKKQWLQLAVKYQKNSNSDCPRLVNSLLLQKIVACDIVSNETYSENYLNNSKIFAKQYLINNFSLLWQQSENNEYHFAVLLSDLDSNLVNALVTTIIEKILTSDESEILNDNGNILEFLHMDFLTNQTSILNSLLMESLRRIWEICESPNNPKLSKKSINKDFNFIEFVSNLEDLPNFIEQMTLFRFEKDSDETQMLRRLIHTVKCLPTHYLSEENQLMTIFTIIIVKKILNASKSVGTIKKIKIELDFVMLSIFEMSPKYPDLFKIFSVKYMFSFEEDSFINLVTLTKFKTSNNLYIVKFILESAIKKVKTDSDVIKLIVKVLMKNQKVKNQNDEGIEYFSNDVFKITCLLLPLIVKEKKAITKSAFRSILAELEDKLHKSLLNSFENVKFDTLSLNKSGITSDIAGDIEDSVISEVIPEEMLATLNAVEAYSLILSRFCESSQTDADKEQLNNLLGSLEYFITHVVSALRNRETKWQHSKASVQLLNIVFRNKHKLQSHPIYNKQDEFFLQVWQALKSRLLAIFAEKNSNDGNTRGNWNNGTLEQIGVAVQYLCELSDIGFFRAHLMKDLADLSQLKNPSTILGAKNTIKSSLTPHEVAKYLWTSFLKANIQGPKAAAMSKNASKLSKNLDLWLRSNFKSSSEGDISLPQETMHLDGEELEQEVQDVGQKEVDLEIAKIIRLILDILTEAIINAKKIDLTFGTLDSIFELQHSLECLLPTRSSNPKRPDSLEPFFITFEGSLNLLNTLVFSRKELLEDRWPTFLQCYRRLLESICRRTHNDVVLDKLEEEKSAELAHGLEKLTQAIVKRKAQISRIAAYLVADISSLLEREPPTRVVRQHLENSAIMLIQAADSSYAMGFLKRSLANSHGQIALMNLHTMYKRYHKFVGTS